MDVTAVDFIVEGSTRSATDTPRSVPFSMSATALDSVADGPSTSIVATKSNNTCMVRITRAERKVSGHGKVEFECFENIFVEVNTSTSNIAFVKSYVQKRLGENYTVVSKDGLEIFDSPTTRGMSLYN